MDIQPMRMSGDLGQVTRAKPVDAPGTVTDSVSIGGGGSGGRKIDPALIREVFHRPELKTIWKMMIPFSYGHDRAVLPMEDGSVCVGTYHQMTCLDAGTGKVRWTREGIDDYFGGVDDSDYHGGRLYIRLHDVDHSNNNHVQVLDALDGNEKWKHPLADYECLRVSDDGDVRMREKNGFVVLDGNDGTEKKKVILKEVGDDTYVELKALKKDYASVVCTPADMYALSPDGEVLWKGGKTFGAAAFVDRGVVCEDKGEFPVLRDSQSGEILWKSPKGKLRIDRLSDRELYGCDIYDLYCLDLSDGHVKWSLKGEQDHYSVIKAIDPDGTPYVARGNRMEALDPETGKPRWSVPLPVEQTERRLSAKQQGDMLYLSDSRRLYIVDVKQGLMVNQYVPEEGSEITSYTLSPDEKLYVQLSQQKHKHDGSSVLHCIDLKPPSAKAGKDQAQDPPGESIVEMDDWVVIGGIRIEREQR
ncbi:MAG: PQQ-binding-like beta-propeller repeat protein [Candidatus Eremiobacteraeota bacterium]|nr:PQQ-binding-like beta-propeller repeat protein [Candidatus Eremiobacteraeota bacterium]